MWLIKLDGKIKLINDGMINFKPENCKEYVTLKHYRNNKILRFLKLNSGTFEDIELNIKKKIEKLQTEITFCNNVLEMIKKDIEIINK
jgi:hypothetical protein